MEENVKLGKMHLLFALDRPVRDPVVNVVIPCAEKGFGTATLARQTSP